MLEKEDLQIDDIVRLGAISESLALASRVVLPRTVPPESIPIVRALRIVVDWSFPFFD